jgi:hypothetical protein
MGICSSCGHIFFLDRLIALNKSKPHSYKPSGIHVCMLVHDDIIMNDPVAMIASSSCAHCEYQRVD